MFPVSFARYVFGTNVMSSDGWPLGHVSNYWAAPMMWSVLSLNNLIQKSHSQSLYFSSTPFLCFQGFAGGFRSRSSSVVILFMYFGMDLKLIIPGCPGLSKSSAIPSTSYDFNALFMIPLNFLTVILSLDNSSSILSSICCFGGEFVDPIRSNGADLICRIAAKSPSSFHNFISFLIGDVGCPFFVSTDTVVSCIASSVSSTSCFILSVSPLSSGSKGEGDASPSCNGEVADWESGLVTLDGGSIWDNILMNDSDEAP